MTDLQGRRAMVLGMDAEGKYTTLHANRSVQGSHHDAVIVMGPVANDNVYLSFNLYEAGAITKRV